jgi:hypothetical protein
MIIKILTKALLNSKLIGIRTYFEDWDKVIIGFVKEINETNVIIEEIDKQGLIIGYMIIEIDDIINLDYDDKYQRKLEFLNKLKKQSYENIQLTVLKKGEKLISYFQELIDEKYITEFHFDDNHYEIGILQEFDEKYILCKNIGNNGEYEGISCFTIEYLTGIKYKGIEQYKIKLLYDSFGNDE